MSLTFEVLKNNKFIFVNLVQPANISFIFVTLLESKDDKSIFIKLLQFLNILKQLIIFILNFNKILCFPFRKL